MRGKLTGKEETDVENGGFREIVGKTDPEVELAEGRKGGDHLKHRSRLWRNLELEMIEL